MINEVHSIEHKRTGFWRFCLLTAVLGTSFMTGACAKTPSNSADESEVSNQKTPVSEQSSQQSEASSSADSLADQIQNGEIEKGQFVNGLEAEGVHFSLYIPKDYSTEKSWPVFINLPGWGSLWFQGEGSNLKESWAEGIASKYPEMVVVSMQLNGYDEQSAIDTNNVTEYLLNQLSLDSDRIYLQGYSAGGETGSMAVSKRPDLYAAFLEISSKWDGDIEAVASAGLPIAFAIVQDDSYYGSDPMEQTMQELEEAYSRNGYENHLYFELASPEWVKDHGFSDSHAAGNGFVNEKPLMDWLFSWTLSNR